MKTLFTTVLMVLFAFSTANAQWSVQTSGTTQLLYSVSAVDNNVVWACGAAGTVLRTTNGGTNWTSVGAAPVTGALYNIFGIDASTALVTGSATSAIVWKTTNGGASWDQVFIQAGGFINVMEIGAGGVGFMQGDPVGGRWSLWRTINSGTTWDSIGMYLPQAGAEAGWNNSLYVSGTNYYFGTNNSKIYASNNAGLSWTAQSTPELNTYAVWFNTLTGVSGGTGGIRTENGGVNWTAVTIPGSGNVNGIAGIGSNFWLSRSTTSIYKSTDAGANWVTDYTAATTISDIGLARIGTGMWAVGATGGIYYTEAVTSVTPISTNVPEKYSLSQNYPNPFNPSTKISFDIVRNGFVSIKVYNSLGQQVGDLVNREMTAGSYQADFNGAELTSGIYFYTIQAGDFVQTKKMMLVK